jgi:hypothetical protein
MWSPLHGAEPSAAVWARRSTQAHNDRPRAVSQRLHRVTDLTIVGNPESDGHLSPWQDAFGHETIPDTHRNGCANEATTGLTLDLFVMLFQDVVFG